MSSPINKVHFQTPEQAIAASVDEQGKPSRRLLELLNLHKIKHDGTLKNIVEASQKAVHILHPSGRPKKRWEINFEKEDEKYSQSVREQTLSLLSELGLFHEFVQSRRHYDYVFFHGSTLSDALSRREALITQWQKGLRFEKMIVLSGPRLVGAHETIDELIAAIPHQVTSPYDNEIDMMRYLWTHLPLPAGMENIEYQWISSPDRSGPDGKPVWATTRDSFNTWYESEDANPPGSCLGISNAPFTLRQHIITKTFLQKHGFANCPIDALGGRIANSPSITICLREFANVLWDYQHYVLDVK